MARHRAALARANELREEFRSRGEFTQAEFRQALREALSPFRGDAYDGFVDHVADQVDKDATREATPEQLVFEGEGWDLGGEYRLSSGRRVAKRLALLEHMEEMIANDEQNVAVVLAASSRKHQELARLRPYFGPGVTKEDAVAAYRSDHGAA